MGLFGITKRVMVVDVDAVLKSKGVRGRPAPRQQLQILRTLSRLMQREKVKVIAVIAGDELNKAPQGDGFEGVRVRYVKNAAKINAVLLRSAKRAGSAAVLVTEDVALEKKAIRAGCDTLRISTFRKLLDDNGDNFGGSKNNSGNRDRSGGNRNNKRRDRGPRPERKKQPRKQQKQKDKPQPEEDEISKMIDLVD